MYYITGLNQLSMAVQMQAKLMSYTGWNRFIALLDFVY